MSESKQRLIDAAFDHLNEMGGAAAGMVAIPSTTPKLFFVIGEKEQIAAMVGAAAPELVEAARKLVDMYDAHFSLNDYSALEISKHYVDELADAFEAARAALAKAGA